MRILVVLLALIAGICRAQAPDVAWPREAKGADGTVIIVYQPQVESWAENNLTGRAAVAVKRPGENEPSYGVIELAARTQIDKSSDAVTLTSLRVTRSNFPGASAEQAQAYLATLRAAVRRDSWPVSVQALQANLAITQARSKQKGQPVKNDPPQILFRTQPSMLVLIDGAPVLRPLKESSFQRVINTTSLMLQDPQSQMNYLRAAGRWWAAVAPTGEWKPAAVPPATLEPARAALDKQYDPVEGKDADGKPLFPEGVLPQIVVATRPTELLQANGAPQMTPIPETELLYMANSRNDILVDLGSQTYFILVSGRWFSSKALEGPWSYVPGKSLPAGFAKIPPDHPMGDLLASVPDTPQAREASIANQIPQTATVQRDVKPSPVAFDGGEPKWTPIDGTPLSYAPNTPAPVIRVDAKSYYMVQNGVWFAATAPPGPYAVAVSVPAVIYAIPPSSPVHYVTYVRVYSSTPTTVFVGYTPGYYGTVVTTDGVVVYGTGYYYPAYIGTYWYPYPPTYGWGAGFTVGFFWGFAAGGGWGYPCCYGGGGVYVSHHNNINIDNSYNRWGNRAQAGQLPSNRPQTKQVGNTTVAKGANNNVYAGRDGEVYRKNDSGDWQQYGGRGEGWSDVERGDRPQAGTRDQPQAATRDQPQAGTRDQPRAENRASLDRQAQSRDTGAARAQQYGGGGGGFSGGGGARMGGGGGRGGGGRR